MGRGRGEEAQARMGEGEDGLDGLCDGLACAHLLQSESRDEPDHKVGHHGRQHDGGAEPDADVAGFVGEGLHVPEAGRVRQHLGVGGWRGS